MSSDDKKVKDPYKWGFYILLLLTTLLLIASWKGLDPWSGVRHVFWVVSGIAAMFLISLFKRLIYSHSLSKEKLSHGRGPSFIDAPNSVIVIEEKATKIGTEKG